jgi:hypothetical protein
VEVAAAVSDGEAVVLDEVGAREPALLLRLRQDQLLHDGDRFAGDLNDPHLESVLRFLIFFSSKMATLIQIAAFYRQNGSEACFQFFAPNFSSFKPLAPGAVTKWPVGSF